MQLKDAESCKLNYTSCRKDLYVVIEHTNPQIISELNLFHYLNFLLPKTLKYPGDFSDSKDLYYGINTMPTTSLTEDEYYELVKYAKGQGIFENTE